MTNLTPDDIPMGLPPEEPKIQCTVPFRSTLTPSNYRSQSFQIPEPPIAAEPIIEEVKTKKKNKDLF